MDSNTKKVRTFGIAVAVEVLKEAKFMVRAYNNRHAAMGGVDQVLFGPSDIKVARHYGEMDDVNFAFEHEIEG
jgi:hypothetical protein